MLRPNCSPPHSRQGHNTRSPFFCIVQRYVSNVLAVKLKQASKMLNRLFFERVMIWDKFVSTFTGITSKSHFSQIEFLFQASSSKNILTNLGKNRKTLFFSLKSPPSTESLDRKYPKLPQKDLRGGGSILIRKDKL